MNLILKQAMSQVAEIQRLGDLLTASEVVVDGAQEELNILKPLMTKKGQAWLEASGLKMEYDRQLANLEKQVETSEDVRTKFEKIDKLIKLMPATLLHQIEQLLEEEAKRPIVEPPRSKEANDGDLVKAQNASLKYRPLLKEFDIKWKVPSQKGRCEHILEELERLDAPATMVEERRSLLLDS